MGGAAGATFFDNEDGTAEFIWRPDYSQAGSYPVTFTVTDNGIPAATASETITITVDDVNRPPVLSTIGDKSVDENNELSFLLTASDPDGNSLSFSKTTGPTGSSLVDNNDGTATFNWTPVPGQAGDYPVTFTVTDNGVPAANDSEPITITVIDPLVVDIAPPQVQILSPADGAVLSSAAVTVSGTASDETVLAGITVNGVAATVVGGNFSADVPLVEGANSITAIATDSSGNTASSSIQVTYTPPVGSLQFSSASYGVAENGAMATITVTRVNGSFGTVGVDYASTDGSATDGSDYTAVSGRLSFADGVTSQKFSIEILGDAINEDNESLSLILSNPAAGAGLGSPSTASLRITDDDVQTDDGSAGGSSSGSIDLITLMLLFSFYLRRFRKSIYS